MDLADIRTRIDEIDNGILALFAERMELAADVAASKRATGKAVFDPARERDKLYRLVTAAPDAIKPEVASLFSLLMSMNKAAQLKILNADRTDSAAAQAKAALLAQDTPFPMTATVACQGVEGAYSQIAACRLFSTPKITFHPTFEGVFRAVRDGACEYGVLPIENSTAGSVNAVYDLLAEYRFSIVRSLRLKIDHQLLAKPGVALADVHEVFSHEQAIAQCSELLDRLGVRVHVCENTARAAELVATSDRTDIAALSSRSCAALYGLDVLAKDVQDEGNNYTRFVVISATPQVFPGATRTSLMVTLPHAPGALYRVLERLYALDINLVKLESRPIPNRDFEFLFYFDLDCPYGSPALDTLLDALDDVCERYTYIGSYTEVV
ncbi:bifunctional chorismate mutase/prephenate dehydratase [Collinsella tanakaei]|uniref:bifunctional chorismate mutase/prephenate dehydratase n=1 Tax=Collinsella tanakaei TaxID=626935 RepID=UPI00195A624C|nr:bifunctional chorismate mutase/prephenate dehydratase [Collinsella tanakaei]MBM6867570.1 chorismate mutase [Collinsella tanakaei]